MEPKTVYFYSHGIRCEADFYQPDASGPRPCIVMAHGFGGIRAASLNHFAERFRDAGLAVLVFDYRHFGTSDGEPRGLIDIKRQRDDYRAAITFARSIEGVDPDRIGLWGTSFSGGHVLTIAAEDPKIAAVICQNPYTDGPPTIIATMRASTPTVWLKLVAAYLDDEFRKLTGRPPRRVDLVGPPGAFAVFTTPDAEAGYARVLGEATGWEVAIPARVFLPLALNRPIRRAHEIACPLLVAVCDDDLITPAQPALRVAHRAPAGELKRYPIGHFDPYFDEWFETVIADETEFFTRHLLE